MIAHWKQLDNKALIGKMNKLAFQWIHITAVIIFPFRVVVIVILHKESRHHEHQQCILIVSIQRFLTSCFYTLPGRFESYS